MYRRGGHAGRAVDSVSGRGSMCVNWASSVDIVHHEKIDLFISSDLVSNFRSLYHDPVFQQRMVTLQHLPTSPSQPSVGTVFRLGERNHLLEYNLIPHLIRVPAL